MEIGVGTAILTILGFVGHDLYLTHFGDNKPKNNEVKKPGIEKLVEVEPIPKKIDPAGEVYKYASDNFDITQTEDNVGQWALDDFREDDSLLKALKYDGKKAYKILQTLGIGVKDLWDIAGLAQIADDRDLLDALRKRGKKLFKIISYKFKLEINTPYQVYNIGKLIKNDKYAKGIQKAGGRTFDLLKDTYNLSGDIDEFDLLNIAEITSDPETRTLLETKGKEVFEFAKEKLGMKNDYSFDDAFYWLDDYADLLRDKEKTKALLEKGEEIFSMARNELGIEKELTVEDLIEIATVAEKDKIKILREKGNEVFDLIEATGIELDTLWYLDSLAEIAEDDKLIEALKSKRAKEVYDFGIEYFEHGLEEITWTYEVHNLAKFAQDKEKVDALKANGKQIIELGEKFGLELTLWNELYEVGEMTKDKEAVDALLKHGEKVYEHLRNTYGLKQISDWEDLYTFAKEIKNEDDVKALMSEKAKGVFQIARSKCLMKKLPIIQIEEMAELTRNAHMYHALVEHGEKACRILNEDLIVNVSMYDLWHTMKYIVEKDGLNTLRKAKEIQDFVKVVKEGY